MTLTRRSVFTAGAAVGAAVILGGAESSNARAEAPVGWETFTRDQDPPVTVSYPRAFTANERFTTDLEYPFEVLAICSEPLSPRPSFLESGRPDLRDLTSEGIFLHAIADFLTEKNSPLAEPIVGGAMPALQVADDATLPGFTKKTVIGRTASWIYSVELWIGPDAPDMNIGDQILATATLHIVDAT